MDEAGTTAEEPVAVVAAIIVQADGQWREAKLQLEAVKQEYVATHRQEGFVFHATDIYSGRGKFKGWLVDQRRSLLRGLLRIPQALNIPVAFGFVRKEAVPDTTTRHMMAFAFCIKAASDLVRVNFPGENMIIMAEDVPALQGKLKRVPKVFGNNLDWLTKHPFDVAIDEINFVQKRVMTQ